ncbi:MAG: hypothetical protein OQK82_00295 [Candidatus Pacearchaeota archaeon]|nr:hypothetical protein [Candidatus Pacearchaeota archaeon]
MDEIKDNRNKMYFSNIISLSLTILILSIFIINYLIGERKKEGKPFFEVAKIFSPIGIFMATGSFFILTFTIEKIKESYPELATISVSLAFFMACVGFALIFISLTLTFFGFILEVKHKNSFPKNYN